MNRYASQLGAKYRRLRAVALVGIAAMISGAIIAMPTAHALVDVGPVDAATGFPMWYEDEAGLALQPCVAPTFCTNPLPGAGAAAVPGNFPDATVYYSASTRILRGTMRLDYVETIEATFAGGVVAAGKQITFSRFRLRVTGLTPLATYTFTYPHGVRTFQADVKGAIDAPQNPTIDTGCVDAPCNFAAALGGEIKPFLTWDPAFAPAPPTGFMGDPAVGHPVIGSPNGTNFVKLTGLNAGGIGVNTIQTNLFNVEGQIATAGFRVPDAPSALTATAGPGVGEISLAWTKPALDGGTRISGYRIFSGDAPATMTPLVDVNAATRTFTDSGLQEGITRYYEVAALNAVGEGAHTMNLSATTFARPSEPVDVVAHQGTNLGEMIVDWKAPVSDGGTPVTAYRILRAQGSGAYEVVATVGDVRRFNDSGLLPLVSYHYAVVAANIVGFGSQSASSCSRAYPWVPALDSLLPCGGVL